MKKLENGFWYMEHDDFVEMDKSMKRMAAKEVKEYTGCIVVWFDKEKGVLTYQKVKGLEYGDRRTAHTTCVGGIAFYKGCKNTILY